MSTYDNHPYEDEEITKQFQHNTQGSIRVPNELEWMIKERIQMTKKKKQRKTAKMAVASALVAGAASFCFAVNVSPTFAQTMGQVPGLSALIDVLKVDAGVEAALENGHTQQVTQSVSSNGIHFTLNNVVADEKRILLSFSLKLDDQHRDMKPLMLHSYTILDQENSLLGGMKNGEALSGDKKDWEYRQRLISLSDPDEKTGVMEGYMEIIPFNLESNSAPALPSAIQLSITSWKNWTTDQIVEGNWDTSFTFDPKLANAKPIEYPHQDFEVQVDQYQMKFKVDAIKLYPTMTSMSIDFLNPEVLPERTGVIYTMHLEDEKGKKYDHLDDEIMTDSGNVRPQFVGSYFDQPKELYLVIQAIELTSAGGGEQYQVNKRIRLY